MNKDRQYQWPPAGSSKSHYGVKTDCFRLVVYLIYYLVVVGFLRKYTVLTHDIKCCLCPGS